MKSYLPGLNTVRFFAALNVIVVHAAGYHGDSYYPLFSPSNAVSIFFVLSGYLITYRLLLEQRKNGAIDLKSFYIRRELRILPLYYLVLFLGGVILPQVGAPSPTTNSMTAMLLLVPQIMLGLEWLSGVLTHLWSIGVEELFYLVFPFALRMFPLIRICAAIIVTSTLVSAVAFLIDSPYLPLLRLMRFECMAVGALAASLVVNRSRWLSVIHHRLVELGAIAALLLIAFFNIQFPFYDLVFSIIVAVFLVNISTNQNPILRLEWPWSKVFGELTYGVYIWHLPILWFWSTRLTGAPFLLAGILTTLAIAWISYHVIEKPILTLKDRFQPRSSVIA